MIQEFKMNSLTHNQVCVRGWDCNKVNNHTVCEKNPPVNDINHRRVVLAPLSVYAVERGYGRQR